MKIDQQNMDVFFIDVKEVVDLLDSEVDVTLPKNIIVYYIVQNLPKEYEMFKICCSYSTLATIQ
jgi:hypothetical protein